MNLNIYLLIINFNIQFITRIQSTASIIKHKQLYITAAPKL